MRICRGELQGTRQPIARACAARDQRSLGSACSGNIDVILRLRSAHSRRTRGKRHCLRPSYTQVGCRVLCPRKISCVLNRKHARSESRASSARPHPARLSRREGRRHCLPCRFRVPPRVPIRRPNQLSRRIQCQRNVCSQLGSAQQDLREASVAQSSYLRPCLQNYHCPHSQPTHPRMPCSPLGLIAMASEGLGDTVNCFVPVIVSVPLRWTTLASCELTYCCVAICDAPAPVPTSVRTAAIVSGDVVPTDQYSIFTVASVS